MMKEEAIQLDLLYQGEQRIQKVHQQCILIMGQTRSGKSTLFNHIRNKPLIGKEISNTICYDAEDKSDSTYAEMGAEYRSITLIPNIYDLSINATLIDLAGFGENRSASGVMAVSYFLSALFQRMKKAKFIIVFDESIVYNMNFNGMAGIFNSFISLFDFNAMKDSVKQNLLGSISFVVTHAKKSSLQYVRHFGEVALRLHNDRNLKKLKNKQLIVEIIQSVVKRQRVQDFQQAKLNIKAPQSTILKNLQSKKWDWFELCHSKGSKNKQNPIILPFQNDFSSLQQQEKNELVDYLSYRCKKVTLGFASLLKNFRELLIANWKNVISIRGIVGDNIVSRLLNNSQFFMLVDSFLHQTFSTYRIQKFDSKIKLKKSLKDPCLLESINSTLEMYDDFISEVPHEVFASQTAEQRLNNLATQIPLLIADMVCLCKDKAEFSKLQKLAFVMDRSIHEYLVFYKIKEDLLSDFQVKLQDQITASLGRKMDYLETIFNSVDLDLIRKLFDQIPNLCRFEQLINTYMVSLRNGSEGGRSYLKDKASYELKYRKLKVDINTYKLQISLSIETTIASLRRVAPLIDYINSFVEYFSENKAVSWNHAFRQFQLAKIKYTKLAASLLMKLDPKEHPSKTRLALDFSQLARCPFETDLFYQQALRQQHNNIKGILTLLDAYSKFQLRWGRIEEAVRTLFQMQHLYMQLQSYSGLTSVKKAIQEIEKNRPKYINEYLLETDKIDQPFDNKQNEKLCVLFKQASKRLQQPQLNLTPLKIQSPKESQKIQSPQESQTDKFIRENKNAMYQSVISNSQRQPDKHIKGFETVRNPQRQIPPYMMHYPKRDNYLSQKSKNLSFVERKPD